MSIENKYALITGGSNGIGYELAKLAAADNYAIVLVARNEEKLKEVAVEITTNYKVSVKIIVKDLSNGSSAEEVFNQLEKENIAVEVLMNNAGYGDYGYFVNTNWEKEARMIMLNIYTITAFTKLFAKQMTMRGSGRILNVGSVAGYLSGPLMSVYYSTKAYVMSFSYAIANELKGSGVSLTLLCPGPVATNFENAAALDSSKLFKNFKPATAEFVARKAYKALMKGKMLVIPGMLNKIMVAMVRFTPRKLLTSVTRKMQEGAKK